MFDFVYSLILGLLSRDALGGILMGTSRCRGSRGQGRGQVRSDYIPPRVSTLLLLLLLSARGSGCHGNRLDAKNLLGYRAIMGYKRGRNWGSTIRPLYRCKRNRSVTG